MKFQRFAFRRNYVVARRSFHEVTRFLFVSKVRCIVHQKHRMIMIRQDSIERASLFNKVSFKLGKLCYTSKKR